MVNSKIILIFILISFPIVSIECKQNNEISGSSQLDKTMGQLSIWPFSKGLSRQLFDMFDLVTDVAMVTFLGIPILGLVALGASMIAPSLNTGTGSARNKRSANESIVSRSKRALLYARNLFDILANLEETFRKYQIMESECQLKVVCEVHKNRSHLTDKYLTFGNEIKNIIRMQSELEEYEIIPLAKIIFNQYSDAATYGNEDNDCDLIYSRCSHKLKDFIEKQNY